jgi:hypothetical protein
LTNFRQSGLATQEFLNARLDFNVDRLRQSSLPEQLKNSKAMVDSPSAQDVADALAITLEREDASGAPWCPPGDGAVLRRWVTDRSASLGSGIRRVVRLARLMAMADGRDYVRFLYARVPALRARLFRSALQEAVADGRLQQSVAVLFDGGVHLREPALAPEPGAGDVFEIDFAQMPRLAALLDFLHNALGFTVVADLLAPLLKRPVPANSATEVARALHAALNAWLSDRLESANHILQAQRMRAFLADRGRVAPEAVDDESILLFWTAIAEASDEERIDGFRLYRSAAGAMLRYRQALRDAAIARHLEASLGRGLEGANTEPATDSAEPTMESWRSPLSALMLPPTNRVKWLNRKEQHSLLNYLGGPAEEADAEPSEDENEADNWKGGLAGDERFDLAFWLTLLRADVFGAAQASIVARLRKRVQGSDAIAQAMTPIDNAAYASSLAVYSELRKQLYLECLATLAVLIEAGAAESLILFEYLGGRDAARSVIGVTEGLEAPTDDDEDPAGALRKLIAPRLKAAFADPASVPEGPGRKVLLEAIAATRKVSRVGFRREDRSDTEMIAALRSGAGAVVGVVRELDRLIGALSQKAPLGDVAGDHARFLAAFRRIYLFAPGN